MRYLFGMLFTMIIITGCSVKDEPTILQNADSIANNDEDLEVDTTKNEDLEVNEWKSYTSEKFNFSLSVPKETEVIESDTSVSFEFDGLEAIDSQQDNKNYMIFLPIGGSDYGFPSADRTENVTIGNREAQALYVQSPSLRINEGVAPYQIRFSEYPQTWNEVNRVEVRIEDIGLYDMILQNITFED